MKIVKEILLLPFFAIVLFIIGCDCDNPTDPNCSNYDPCYEVSEVKANFNFYEAIRDTLIQTDTLIAGYTTFKAEEEYESVKWLIGDDPRVRTEHQFTLSFSSRDTGTFKVTLMVERTPNKGCFPDDDGLDTLVKYFTRLHNLGDNHPIIGDYHGYLASNPEDTFTVNVQYKHSKFSDPSDPTDKDFFIININKGCNISNIDYEPTIQVADSYRALHFDGWGFTGHDCHQVVGYVFAYDSFQKVRIPFTYVSPSSIFPDFIFVDDVFYGIRQ